MKNIITKVAQRGDIVFLDDAGKIRFLAKGTYDRNTFDSRYTIVGVVAYRQGNQVMVVNKNNTTKKWSLIYKWKISGFTLDGLPHETTIKFHADVPAPENPVFTYTATAIDEVVQQLLAWTDAYFAQTGKRYNCYKLDEGTIQFGKDAYENWYERDLTMSGLTVTADVGTVLPTAYNTYAENGLGGEYKGMNMAQFRKYISASTSSTFNPSKPVQSLPTYPLSMAAYLSEIGAFCRGIYGEGEDGYWKYLNGYRIQFPSHKSAFEPVIQSGHKNTYLLLQDTYTTYDGQTICPYEGAAYCAETEFAHPLLAKGQWFLPSMYELMKIAGNIALDYSDPVSESLIAIGGTRLYLASTWSSCRYGSSSAWIFNGYTGASGSSYFGSRNYCWPCVLLDLSECEG